MPEQVAHRGKEKGEADGVSQEARSEEEGASNENKHAGDDLLAGDLTAGDSLLKTRERSQSLAACEVGAEQSGDDDESQRSGNTEVSPQHHEEDEFYHRDDEEEGQEPGKEHDSLRYTLVGICHWPLLNVGKFFGCQVRAHAEPANFLLQICGS